MVVLMGALCFGLLALPGNGVHELACGSPRRRNPILRRPKPEHDVQLVAVLRGLPTEDDTKAVFLVIGDKGNHLRFLASGSILAYHLFREGSSACREK
jgi:hypothetical protein